MLIKNEIWMHPLIAEGWYNTTKKYVVPYGGRGSTKSMGCATISALEALEKPGSRILCVRGTQNKLSESSLETLKNVIGFMNYDHHFTMTENTLKCNNGSDFLFYGARNYMSFKSLQGITLVWVDEATELSEAAWEVLIPTIRPIIDTKPDPRFLISFNPEEEKDWVWDNFIINKHPNAYVIKLNFWDNPKFPDTLKEEMELDRERNTAKYLHVWEGELRQEVEGAVWNKDLIRIKHPPEDQTYEKVVVAIDPSVTSKITSDPCGLIVAGKVTKGEYVVLNDSTAIRTPKEWATKAISLYRHYGADHIVYESNMGGDLIPTVIRQIDSTIRCIKVHASRAKRVRAEEILYLYEDEQVTHARHFRNLETEMLTFTGNKKDKSPNALDALVYALKDLSPRIGHAPRGMVPASRQNMQRVGVMRLK